MGILLSGNTSSGNSVRLHRGAAYLVSNATGEWPVLNNKRIAGDSIKGGELLFLESA